MADRFEFTGEVYEEVQYNGYAISALRAVGAKDEEGFVEEMIIETLGYARSTGLLIDRTLGKLHIIVERVNG